MEFLKNNWSFLVILAILLLLVVRIAGARADENRTGEEVMKAGYNRISQETAKEMMEREDGHVIVDVRRQGEYDRGHIPGAVLIPVESISGTPPAELPDKDQIILVYCRTGVRSREASQKLADMGYTNIYEFGGIESWTGEVVR